MERLEIHNFLNHEHTDIEIPDVLLLMGPNGSGKTALVSAIEWVVTGSCRDLDANGSRTKDLVRHGATEMRVRLHGPDGPYAERTFLEGKMDLQVSGASGRQSDIEANLWQILGIPTLETAKCRRLIRSFLQAGDLSAWSDRSWHEIMGMLSQGTAKDVLLDLKNRLGSTLPEAMRVYVEEYVNRATSELWTSIAKVDSRPHVVDAYERHFYARRRDVKRELRDAKAQAVPPPLTPEFGSMSDADLHNERQRLKETTARCDTEIRVCVAKLEKATQLKHQRQLSEQQEKFFEDQESEIEEILAREPEGAEIAELNGKITKAKGEEKKLSKEIETGKYTPGDVADAVRAVIAEFGDKLSVKSMTALKQVERRKEGNQEQLQAELDECRVYIRELQDQVLALETRRKEADDARNRLEKVRDYREKEKPSVDYSDLDNEDLYQESLQKHTEAKEGMVSRLEIVEREIGRREYARQAVTTSVEQLEGRHQALDLLVEAMRHPAVKTGSGGAIIERIQAQLRDDVHDLIGNVPFDITSDGQIRVNDHPWDVLSDSERMRLGCAIASGLAGAFSFPWLIIDGGELIVGEENRNRFMSWVSKQRQRFRKVIVLAASGAAGLGEMKSTPAMSLGWIQDGKVVVK